MAKLTSVVKSKTKRVLVFGPPKSGKTELCARLAEKFNVLYIGNENGHDTMYKLPPELQEKIEVVALPDSRVYPIAAETSLKLIRGTETIICDLHGKVNCPICTKDGAATTRVALNELDETWVVIYDSLSQLVNSMMSHITKGKADDYKLQTDDWGSLMKLMDMFLSQVQAARYNIVVISHEMGVEMNDGKEKLVAVAGTKNFSRNSAKYFGEVIYCELKNKKHVFGSSTSYANHIVTGSRDDFSLEDYEDPKLLYLWFPELGKKKVKPPVGAK